LSAPRTPSPDICCLLQALKRRNIRFIVAPYEADAQMAYLALNGLADVVLTEDSDLLCYGCPTVRRHTGRRVGRGTAPDQVHRQCSAGLRRLRCLECGQALVPQACRRL
jgi:hypothetical protein